MCRAPRAGSIASTPLDDPMVDPAGAAAVRQCCQGGVEDQTFMVAEAL
jgi:hypothetical protein